MLGENLQKARQAVELTQEEVAEKLYFTRQAISRWEAGKTEPNIETLIALASLYRTDLLQLTTGIEPRPAKKHFHLLAAVGSLLFNFLFGCWLFVTLVLLLAAAYLILISFLILPFMLIFATVTHNPSVSIFGQNGMTGFDWWQYLVAFALCSLAILACRYLWQLTKFLVHWLMIYLKYNLKSVYS